MSSGFITRSSTVWIRSRWGVFLCVFILLPDHLVINGRVSYDSVMRMSQLLSRPLSRKLVESFVSGRKSWRFTVF